MVNRALQAKTLTQAALDEALSRSLAIRFKFGEFDPPEMLPWAALGPDTVNSQEHRQLAREAAIKGVSYLLKHGQMPRQKCLTCRCLPVLTHTARAALLSCADSCSAE